MKKSDRNGLVRDILDGPIVYAGVTLDPVETEDYVKITVSGGARVYILSRIVTVTVRLSADTPRLSIDVSTYNDVSSITFAVDNREHATDLATRFISTSIEAIMCAGTGRS